MKKTFISIGVILVACGWLLSQYWYYLPGIIAAITSPVGDRREITWSSGPQQHQPRSDKPNILLIVVDDLGFNDITFYGGGIAGGTVPTPNIDSIASDGIHFPNGYAGHATCAPSRASLLTGRFGPRIGFEFTPAPPSFARLVSGDGFIEENADKYPDLDTLGLPSSEVTIPEALKPEDYHSIAIGKWHLGASEGLHPLDQGFDEFLGLFQGASLFMPKDSPEVVNSKQEFDPIDRFLWANLSFSVRHNSDNERFEPNSHLTDYFSREAVKAINANSHRPFFMYLAYNAPHTPLQSEKADYDALGHIQDHTERTYAGMIRGLDRGIGQVLRALRDNEIDDNTLVIFVSDNGGAHYVGLPDLNAPYRGWKITFFEGGIRTPYFFRWPKKIPAGSQFDSAVSHTDVFSTVLNAAGAKLPHDRVIDGVDLLNHSLATPTKPLNRPLFWRAGGYKVVMQNSWKLQYQMQDGRTWLYNLLDDPTEKLNLSETNPEKLAAMMVVLEELDSQMSEPLWPAITEGPIAVDYTLNNRPDEEYETIIWTN